MDIKKIKAIVELVKESGIAELEITEGEEKLKISTMHNVGQTHYTNPYPQMQHMSHTHEATHPTTPTPAVINVASEPIAPSMQAIKSPMVGTFYRASSPSSAPFAEIGQTIKTGQVVCIIEAMKLMNQIESDRDGVIKEILIKDGAPVEYGQPLFIVE